MATAPGKRVFGELEKRKSATTGKIGEPKTDASYREIAIPSFLVPILREHLAKFSEPGADASYSGRCVGE